MGRFMEECKNLKSATIDFNSENVTHIDWMFWGCKNLEKVHLKINTKNVICMSSMFDYCEKLKQIALDYDTQNTIDLREMSRMFENCITPRSVDLCTVIIPRRTNLLISFS